MTPAVDQLERVWASPSVDNQSASIVQVESNRLVPLTIVLAVMSGMAIAISLFLSTQHSRIYGDLRSEFEENQQETRMLEYYLLELDAKFINAGLKDPADAISKKLQKYREDRDSKK